MPNTGWKTPSSVVNDATVGGPSWTNPGNAAVSDDTYASITLSDSDVSSKYLWATGYDFSAMPNNAIINGIEFGPQRRGENNSGGAIGDYSIKLIIEGSLAGNDKAEPEFGWEEEDTTKIRGSPTDTWGLTPTAVQLKASTSGVAYAAQFLPGLDVSHPAWVDAMLMRIDYDIPSLVASPGSYTITGTAAGLHRIRTITAASGTYSINGTAAGLKAARKLTPVSAGLYAINGTPAGLFETHRVAASAGSYVIAGTAASPKAARQIAPVVGAYSINGTAAELLFRHVVSASAGAYAITGALAALLRNHVIVASSGSYLISGADLGLHSSRTIAASAGSYVITGSATGLISGRKLVAIPASYSISGTAASLHGEKDIAASPGAYTITGTPANFTVLYSDLIASSGSYLLVGSAVGLLQERFLVASSGSYVITGTAADLVQSTMRLSPEPGSYQITGTSVQLLADQSLVALPGSYVVTGSPINLTVNEPLPPVHAPGAPQGNMVTVTYWLDAAFTQPLPCCPTDLIPPPIKFISSDSFDLNHLFTLDQDDQGRRWIIDSGDWDELTGTARTVGQGLHLAHIDQATAIDVEITVQLGIAGAGTSASGIVARFAGASRYYAATINHISTGPIVQILRVLNGQRTVLDEVALNGILLGPRLTFRLTGPVLEVLVNGASVLVVNDSAIQAAGFVGLIAEDVDMPVNSGAVFYSWYAEASG